MRAIRNYIFRRKVDIIPPHPDPYVPPVNYATWTNSPFSQIVHFIDNPTGYNTLLFFTNDIGEYTGIPSLLLEGEEWESKIEIDGIEYGGLIFTFKNVGHGAVPLPDNFFSPNANIFTNLKSLQFAIKATNGNMNAILEALRVIPPTIIPDHEIWNNRPDVIVTAYRLENN